MWFKMLPPMKGDTSKMNQTKYCTFHRVLGHATNDCTSWMKYLKKLVKEGKYDQYVNKPAARPRREADVDTKPPTKTIYINDIFAKSEHLGATNNSKKRKIQQARSIFQVQAIDPVLGSIGDFTKQVMEGVDFPHNDALVISVQLAHAIVDKIMVDNGSLVNILQLSAI
ncbi:uncharacterized protein [Pyrus communis]|uniref:uncharacterized protein n=1 Tax=Pyrus communis TaxID=23211 RepID=UPI0035BFD3D7